MRRVGRHRDNARRQSRNRHEAAAHTRRTMLRSRNSSDAARIPIGRPRRRATCRAGFSLIELMVALTLAGILLLGLSVFFVSSSRSFSEAERASRQIENGRYALALIAEEIRHAGLLRRSGQRTLNLPPTPPSRCPIPGATRSLRDTHRERVGGVADPDPGCRQRDGDNVAELHARMPWPAPTSWSSGGRTRRRSPRGKRRRERLLHADEQLRHRSHRLHNRAERVHADGQGLHHGDADPAVPRLHLLHRAVQRRHGCRWRMPGGRCRRCRR